MTELTHAEHETARMWAAGMPRQEIAQRRGVHADTVDNLRRRAEAKLGVAPRDRRQLAQALLTARVAARHGGRINREGLRPGDSVRIVGGRFAGRAGVYVRSANSYQVRIQVGGATFAITRRFVAAGPSGAQA